MARQKSLYMMTDGRLGYLRVMYKQAKENIC
jgi:hypothetical protein